MPKKADNLVRLSSETDLTGFDCEDADLNDFLLDDARPYMAELLAVTYLVNDGQNIAAFFSLANDKLTCAPDDPQGKTEWNKLARNVPNRKRRKSFPAVKLGRLGVDKRFKHSGYGRDILDYLKNWFIVGNKTGCRFIMVDAYNKPEIVKFYEKNGFRFLTPNDKTEDTRQMYYDLKPLADLMASGSNPVKN
jgi:GNAT superfamily N-acetyltransferase